LLPDRALSAGRLAPALFAAQGYGASNARCNALILSQLMHTHIYMRCRAAPRFQHDFLQKEKRSFQHVGTTMPRARTLLLLLLVVTVFAASLSASESISDGSQQVRRIIYPPACVLVACWLCLVFFLSRKICKVNLSHLFGRDKQVYIVYLGHLPASTDASEPEGSSAVEFAHQDLLNQVLDDGRSKTLFFLPQK
jgi:hypothetical protein